MNAPTDEGALSTRGDEDADEHAFGSWRGIIVFCVLAYALAWLVVLPLWLNQGLFPVAGGANEQQSALSADASPQPEVALRALLPMLLASAMMLTPAISALVTLRFVDKVPLGRAFAVLGAGTLRTPSGQRAAQRGRLHPFVRVLLFALLSIAVMVLLVVLSVLVAILLGGIEPDWQMRTVREQMEAAGLTLPLGIFIGMQLLQILIAAVIPNGLLAAGEELGWRGYLTAALRRRGLPTVPMIVVSGAIWGAWHAPVLLLGHNFATQAPISIPIMMVGCICVGAVLSWLREASGSIWPAAIGHGALNAAAGLGILISAGGSWKHPIIANPLGVSGWVVFGLAGVCLIVLWRRTVRLRAADGVAGRL